MHGQWGGHLLEKEGRLTFERCYWGADVWVAGYLMRTIVALKLLVSLISRLVACSARIVADKQTNKQTDRQTDTQNNYCNPRWACAPRVNWASASGSEPTCM